MFQSTWFVLYLVFSLRADVDESVRVSEEQSIPACFIRFDSTFRNIDLNGTPLLASEWCRALRFKTREHPSQIDE